MKKEFDRNDDLERLWNEHKDAIEAAAYNYKIRTGLAEDVEDLVQDAYFGLVKAVETYDPEAYPDVPFSAWLIIKCKGLWSKYLRDRDPLRTAASLDAPAYGDRTLGDFVADTVADDAEGVEDQVVKDLMMCGYMDQVRAAMANLDPETASIIKLAYIDGVPVNQLRVENAASKIRRGIREIRRALIAQGVDMEGGLHYAGN